MENTRIYDRAPIKDVRVKDPQIGTRTPQILMDRKDGEYLRGDILDANATSKKIKKVQDSIEKFGSIEGVTELKIGDSDEVKAFNMGKLKEVSIQDSFLVDINYGFGTGSWNANDGGKAFITTATGIHVEYTIGKDGTVTKGQEVDVLSINNDLFEIVTQLPDKAKAKKGHIYCVKDTTSKDAENRYTEFALIDDKSTGAYEWEIIGQFHADPDLSGYAKLSGANFTGNVSVKGSSLLVLNTLTVNGEIAPFKVGSSGSITTTDPLKQSANKVYATNGSLANIGSPESFVFTLEDGTKVTKSIRVMSTTSEAGA